MTYQKFPNSKQLAAALNSNKLENIYFFLGEEEGEKEKIIEKIISMSGSISDEENYSARRFHIENGELSEAVEFALSASMFSERKICVMLNVNFIKSKYGDKDLLRETIDSIPDSNILIMTSSENRLPTVIDSNYRNKINVYQFWRLFDNDILNYLINSIRKNGMDIDRRAADYLIELTGRNIKKVDDAVGMLIDSGEKLITTEIVGIYIKDNKDVTNFQFIDSLFRKDRNSFSELLKVLDSGTHELVLLKMIMKQAELIEKYNELFTSGTNSETVLHEIGINSRNQKNFMDCVKKFPDESIKKIFPLISKADKRIKSYNYSNGILSNPLFELVAEMILDSPRN